MLLGRLMGREGRGKGCWLGRLMGREGRGKGR